MDGPATLSPMLRRVLVTAALVAATVPFTSAPASAICTIYVPTGEIVDGAPNVGPWNCNYCPVAERIVEKHTGDLIECPT